MLAPTASALDDDAESIFNSLSSRASMCQELHTGRTIVVRLDASSADAAESAAEAGSTPYLHDVSLCNVMGMGADYLYVPYVNRVYVLGDPLGIPAAVILSILVVLMMVVMGHNLQVRFFLFLFLIC